MTSLDRLEAEAMHVLREVAAECERPALLFSGGKDSAVLLHLAAKAFRPAALPFPALHVATGHDFPEVLAFRDRCVAALGAELVVASVQASIDAGRVPDAPSRNRLQTTTLLDAIAEHGFTACLGGARRDEERSRAKERVVSLRNDIGQWDPQSQRAELWDLYNTRLQPGEHLRVFPLSNWTELDVWEYVEREAIELPSLYFAHVRPVVERDGLLYADASGAPERVRYRTVGDMTCTAAVRSGAATIPEIIAEVAGGAISERGQTRADDRVGDAAMEDRKREGYF